MDRHIRRRMRNKQVKRDAAILLDRIVAMYPVGLSPRMRTEIAEMRSRLQPPQGVNPIVIYTRYPQQPATPDNVVPLRDDRKVETKVIGYREPRYPGEPRSRREIRELVQREPLSSKESK